MLTEEKKVFGHAPRKALGVKKTIKTGAGKPKSPNKTVKAVKAEKAAAPAAVAKPVSILRSPRSPSATPPSSPKGHSPTSEQEEWRSHVATLTARLESGRVEMLTVKQKLEQLEKDLRFSSNTAAEDRRAGPSSLSGE